MTDGIHPWGTKGVSFIGGILYSWWRRYEEILSELIGEETSTSTSTASTGTGLVSVSGSKEREKEKGKEMEKSSRLLLSKAGRARKKAQSGTLPPSVPVSPVSPSLPATATVTATDISTDISTSAVPASDSGSDSSRSSNRVIIPPLVPYILPVAMYLHTPIGTCTRCDAMTDDSDALLKPLGIPKGFQIITRVKVGYGGFNPNDTREGTKSFKKSYQSEEKGSEISFKFYGSSVKVAIWQRRDGMGVLHAVVDGDIKNAVTATGFFKGYTWAMERNNTGRSQIMPLFEGLEDREHVIKFTVGDQPANKWVVGYTTQIFALLSASDNRGCKTISLI